MKNIAMKIMLWMFLMLHGCFIYAGNCCGKPRVKKISSEQIIFSYVLAQEKQETSDEIVNALRRLRSNVERNSES